MSERKQKKQYLRTNVIEKGYDPDKFFAFCEQQCPGQNIDVNSWSMDEIKNLVSKFVANENKSQVQPKKIETQAPINKPAQTQKKKNILDNPKFAGIMGIFGQQQAKQPVQKVEDDNDKVIETKPQQNKPKDPNKAVFGEQEERPKPKKLKLDPNKFAGLSNLMAQKSGNSAPPKAQLQVQQPTQQTQVQPPVTKQIAATVQQPPPQKNFGPANVNAPPSLNDILGIGTSPQQVQPPVNQNPSINSPPNLLDILGGNVNVAQSQAITQSQQPIQQQQVCQSQPPPQQQQTTSNLQFDNSLSNIQNLKKAIQQTEYRRVTNCKMLNSQIKPNIQITIKITRMIDKNSGGTFEIITEPMKWKVRRSFKQFAQVRDYLTSLYPEFYIHPISLSDKGTENKSTQKIFFLERMMNNLLTQPTLKTHPIIQDFLSLDGETIFNDQLKRDYKKKKQPNDFKDFETHNGKINLAFNNQMSEFLINSAHIFNFNEGEYQKLTQLSRQLNTGFSQIEKTLGQIEETFENIKKSNETHNSEINAKQNPILQQIYTLMIKYFNS